MRFHSKILAQIRKQVAPELNALLKTDRIRNQELIGFRGMAGQFPEQIGTSKNVSTAMPFAPLSKRFWLHDISFK